MLGATMMLLQAASGPPASEKIDLTRLPGAPETCVEDKDGAASGDVVVCGRRNDEQYRLRPLPDRPVEPVLPRAEVHLPGGVVADATAKQTKSPDGKPDKRIMVTFKIPF